MKQTFEIPQGCTRVTIEQQGNQIITTFEPEVKFKDGDIVFKKYNEKCAFVGGEYIFIFNKIDENNFIYYHACYSPTFQSTKKEKDFGIGAIGDITEAEIRLATESEQQQLWDALAKVGKKWNAEKKCIEELELKRWRAEEGCRYYFATPYKGCLGHCSDAIDYRSGQDNKRYKAGNYFKTEAEANSAGLKMKELLIQINP